MFVGRASGSAEQVACARREEQRVGAAVVGMAATLDQSASFELVDEADHLIAVDAHRVGKLLLGAALRRRPGA